MGAIANYPLGSLIYFLVFIIGTVLANEAQASDRKKIILFIACILALFFGLRTEKVGIDTVNYLRYYNETIQYGPNITASWYDTVYVYGMSLFRMENGFYLFNFIVSFATNLLVLLRLWDFKEQINLSLSFGLFYSFFIPVELNIARQLLAIALVFWGSRYIFTHKVWLFLAFLLFAVGIHRSSLIAILLLCALYFIKDEMSYSSRTVLSCASLVMPVCVIAAPIILINTGYLTDYAKYFESNDIKIGLMTILKVLVLIIGLSKHNLLQRFDAQVKATVFFTIVGLAISIIGYLFDYMERIGYFFSIFDVVSLSYLARAQKDIGNADYERMIWVLCLYVLFTALSGNGQGILPYESLVFHFTV